MKKFYIVAFIFLFCTCLFAIIGGKMQNSENETNITTTSSKTYPTKTPIVWETNPPEVPKIPIDADSVAKFQGEWEGEYSNVIISGIDVNFIYYDTLDEDYDEDFDEDFVSDIHTFHFEQDKNGKLVVCNPYSQPRYILSVNKKGKLVRQSIDEDEEKDIYEYKSDNTIVPEMKLEPEIGMTEDEVLNSKWGYPKKRNTTKTINGIREQWVYKKGYIYLVNGIVTSIQKI